MRRASPTFDMQPISSSEELVKDIKGDAVNTDSDERRPFVAKPRYDGVSLRTHFKQKMLEMQSMPYEYLETLLYGVTATHACVLFGKPLGLDVVQEMHHIVELKNREMQLSEGVRRDLNSDLERVININSAALEEYRSVCTLLQIASALLVKWRLISYDEYSYRLNGHAVNIRPLNLFTMNSSLFTVESLWYCQIIDTPPLSSFVDVYTKQYAIVLRSEVARTLKVMLRLNNADFWKVPSIEGYLAKVNPVLQYRYHMQADLDVQLAPEYQSLSMPEGLTARCRMSPAHTKCLLLKKRLQDLEAAYRAFEKSLLSCFMRKLLQLDLEPV